VLGIKDKIKIAGTPQTGLKWEGTKSLHAYELLFEK